MSRSFRKTPICGNCGNDSEKQDKRTSNRKFRRKNRAAVHKEEYEEIRMKEISNTWNFLKDGKGYFGWMKDYEAVDDCDLHWNDMYKKLLRK